MVQFMGIALWALIPAFVAKKKGRNFWGYYFLSFVISPLITIIIVCCLSNISNRKESSVLLNNEKISFCRKCGESLVDNSRFCEKCGTKVLITVDEYVSKKKCELCNKETENVYYCEIKDEYGTRYRSICEECVLKHNAKEQKNDL